MKPTVAILLSGYIILPILTVITANVKNFARCATVF